MIGEIFNDRQNENPGILKGRHWSRHCGPEKLHEVLAEIW